MKLELTKEVSDDTPMYDPHILPFSEKNLPLFRKLPWTMEIFLSLYKQVRQGSTFLSCANMDQFVHLFDNLTEKLQF